MRRITSVEMVPTEDGAALTLETGHVRHLPAEAVLAVRRGMTDHDLGPGPSFVNERGQEVLITQPERFEIVLAGLGSAACIVVPGMTVWRYLHALRV